MHLEGSRGPSGDQKHRIFSVKVSFLIVVFLSDVGCVYSYDVKLPLGLPTPTDNAGHLFSILLCSLAWMSRRTKAAAMCYAMLRREANDNFVSRAAGNGADIWILRELCCRNQVSMFILVHKH
jgi:hypothetical protein